MVGADHKARMQLGSAPRYELPDCRKPRPILIFDRIPADADAQSHPTAAEHIHLGGLLGHQDGLGVGEGSTPQSPARPQR